MGGPRRHRRRMSAPCTARSTRRHIEPNPRQPRQVFDDEALAELVHSIREFGLMQPIVVRALDDATGHPATNSSWGSGAGARLRQPA